LALDGRRLAGRPGGFWSNRKTGADAKFVTSIWLRYATRFASKNSYACILVGWLHTITPLERTSAASPWPGNACQVIAGGVIQRRAPMAGYGGKWSIF
jgi:hypothetical protein